MTPSQARKRALVLIGRIRDNERALSSGDTRAVNMRVSVRGHILDAVAKEFPNYVHRNDEGRVCFMGVPVRII